MAHNTQLKTGKGPCPATGQTGNWSYAGDLHQPSFIISYCGGTALSDWIAVGEASTGGAMFRPNLTTNQRASDEITLTRWQSPSSSYSDSSDQKKAKASPDILHQVYTLMLHYAPLTEAHERALQKRKMPLQALKKRLHLGSLPVPKKRPRLAQKIYEASGLTRAEILQVPGFFINKKGHLSIAGRGGILIATTNAAEQIIGFQIRSARCDLPKSDLLTSDLPKSDLSKSDLGDHQKSIQRYTWLSSGQKDGGVGSGAPASFLGDRRAESAALSEGAFKIAALDYLDMSTAAISIAGVGSTRAAMERIDELPCLKLLNLYFDGDWIDKPQVLRALIKMVKAALQRGLEVKVWAWPPQWGKGIDDALLAGMPKSALVQIPVAGLLRCIDPPKSHPRIKTDKMPTWSHDQTSIPEMGFFLQQTKEALEAAFEKSVGTFIAVSAPTNTGKTYSTNRLIPEWNIRAFKCYKTLEESEVELRQLYGDENVGVLYGRMEPPKSDKDEAARLRYAKAGCPNYSYMKERAEKGQWACAGCPLAPDHREPGKETCAYWRHRKELFANLPKHLLAVQQALGCNRQLVEHLPQGLNHELFEQKYTTLVIDDCPQFDAVLSREKGITPHDVKVWREHPELDPTNPEHGALIAWLATLQKLLDDEQDADTFELLRGLSKVISQQDSFVCEEEAFDYELPRRGLKNLASWLARGGPVRFEEYKPKGEKRAPRQAPKPSSKQAPKQGEQTPKKGEQAPREGEQAPKQAPTQEGEKRQGKGKVIFYLAPPNELLESLKYMRIINLDATHDEYKLRWLAQTLGMDFEAPDFVRRDPKIVQIGDLLWSREQLVENKEVVIALIHFIHEQGGIALGFKELDDPEITAICDGYWGRDERGLNAFQGATGVGLLGHYALPVEEARKMAHRQRALAWHLGAAPPETMLTEAPDEERVFSDPWRPWVRTMHCDEDPWVEHLRRHHSTSGPVQGSSRDRKTDTITFLLSGEPLDGLPWEIPVEVMTKRELRDFLGLSTPTKKPREINEGLQRHNEELQAIAKERVEALLPEVQAWAEGLEQFPGVRQLIRHLQEQGNGSNQNLAYKLLEELKRDSIEYHTDLLLGGECVLKNEREREPKESYEAALKNTEQSMAQRDTEDQVIQVTSTIEEFLSPECNDSSFFTDNYCQNGEGSKFYEQGVSSTALKLKLLRAVPDTPHSMASAMASEVTEQPPLASSHERSPQIPPETMDLERPERANFALYEDEPIPDMGSGGVLCEGSSGELRAEISEEQTPYSGFHLDSHLDSRLGSPLGSHLASGCFEEHGFVEEGSVWKGDSLALVSYETRPEASCWPLDEAGARQIDQLGESLQHRLLEVYEKLLEKGRSWREASALCLGWLTSMGHQLSEELFWSCFWWRKGLTPGLMLPWVASSG